MKTLLIAVLLSAACTENPGTEIEVDDVDAKGDDLRETPLPGAYTFEPTLNGAAANGDVLSLTLTASRTFQLTIEDEWSGRTTHNGTYKLYRATDSATHYIDFIEAGRTTRYEYSIDVVDNATLWLRAITSQRWFDMSLGGGDCRTAGCDSGSSCNECWGEYVCLVAGTSC